jgi:hypothetical protein
MPEPKIEKQVIEELLLQTTLNDKEIRATLKLVASEDALEQEKAIQSMKGKTPYNKQVLYNMLKEYLPKKEPKEEEIKENIIETSLIVDGDKLYEEICDGEGNCQFISITDGVEECISGLRKEDALYVPINDNSIKEGAVLLPTGIETFESLDALIKEIQQHIHKYLDVSEDFEIFASYYVLLSWVYDKVSTLPYLRALGDTGTGKSRFLKVIGNLCYKPCIIAGAITPAPIYRMIEKFHGTLIIDEADMKNSDSYNEVIKILNCGFEKGTPVIRCDKDDPNDLQFFCTYCPKLIATRQSFQDKALESRCLNEIMRQTGRKGLPAILPKEFYEEQSHIRNKLLYFRLTYSNIIDDNAIQTIDLGDIEPRLKQATSSFAVLFANIPELFERFKAFLARYQKDLVEERAGSLEGKIVNALFNKLCDELNISISEISALLGECPPISNTARDTCNWKINSIYISAGDILKKMEEDEVVKTNAAGIGRRLKALGLKTKFIFGVRKRVIILDDKEQLRTLYLRYVPALPDSADISDMPDSDDSQTEHGQQKLDEYYENH